jgi:hypothetical protein
VIESSKDGSSWFELDRRETRDLDGKYVTKTFSIVRREELRMICFRLIGKNSAGRDELIISA